MSVHPVWLGSTDTKLCVVTNTKCLLSISAVLESFSKLELLLILILINMIFRDKTMMIVILLIIIISMITVNIDSPTANQVCLLPLSPLSSFSSPSEYIS